MAALTATRTRRSSRVRYASGGRGAPEVWLTGLWDLTEFAALRRQLDATGGWPMNTDLPATTEAIAAAARAPEVIFLAEPRPGVHRQALADTLLAAAPLTRIVVVAGSWCEGELRSGRPLVGMRRLYCHQVPAWWHQAVTAHSKGLAPHWSAPASFPPTPAELPGGGQLQSKRVLIGTQDLAVFETLASSLAAAGAACQWQSHEGPDAQPPDTGIWDGGQLDAGERSRLATFCERFANHPAPVLVLLDYPRPEHSEAIRRAGASALLGKPYSVDALFDALARVATPTATLA